MANKSLNKHKREAKSLRRVLKRVSKARKRTTANQLLLNAKKWLESIDALPSIKIDPHTFDFSQLIPDIKLTKETAKDWYDKRFNELGIKDFETKELLLKVLDNSGLLPFPIETILGVFSRFAMPLVRQAFPTNMINSIVSVQPMTTPASTVYSLNYKKAKK